jgi:tRNA pseudouridine32 synthase/23S rRNA pseudouridine746 synthase
VEKVSGLLAVPGRGPEKRDCLLQRVQQQHPEALLVHRLDMETSGLVLFARDGATQRDLGRLFQQRRVFKRYAALVRGVPEPPEGEVALPLMLNWPKRPLQKVDYLHGRPSHTRYRVVDQDAAGAWSRLELLPTTGRSHQLRVHLAAIGHPILGDALYADPVALAMAGRLMLHAETLRFEHPAGGCELTLTSPVPF